MKIVNRCLEPCEACDGCIEAHDTATLAASESGDEQMELLRRLPLPSDVIAVLVCARDLLVSYDAMDGWRDEMQHLDATLREFCGCDHNSTAHDERCALTPPDKDPESTDHE